VFKGGNPYNAWGLRMGWEITFFLLCVALLVTAIIGGTFATVRHFSPCATDDDIKGYKNATAPDGTPVMVPTAWCVQYKPGREGEKL
jgi:hypothetical protein